MNFIEKLLDYSLIIFLILLVSCNKDTGNYTYENIENIQILSSSGENLDGKLLTFKSSDSIIIEPTLKSKTPNYSHNVLKYEWSINGKVISNDKVLKAKSGQIESGKNFIKFLVSDSFSTYSNQVLIPILVIESVGKGIYLLTEDENENSKLGMISLEDRNLIRFENVFGSIIMGAKPIKLEVSYHENNQKLEYDNFLIVTKGGNYPIFSIDFYTLKPIFKIAAKGSMFHNQTLRPLNFSPYTVQGNYRNNFDGTLQIDGKCHQFINGKISGDVNKNDSLDYDFGGKDTKISLLLERMFMAGYDIKNERIRIFGSYPHFSGIYNNNIEFKFDHNKTKGFSLLGISYISHKNFPAFQFLLKNNDQVLSIIAYQFINSPFIVQIADDQIVTEIANGKNFIYYENNWYFSYERSIYKIINHSLKIEKILTLPFDDTGNIVNWDFNLDRLNGINRIGIATFQGSSNEERKGSFYLYNTQTEEYQIHNPYSMDLVKDMLICF